MNPDQIKEMLARELYEQHLRHTHRIQPISLSEPWERLRDHERQAGGISGYHISQTWAASME